MSSLVAFLRCRGIPFMSRPWAPTAVLALLLVACGGGGTNAVPVLSSPPAAIALPPATAQAATPTCVPQEGPQAATTSPFAVGGTITGRADRSFIMVTVPSHVWTNVNPSRYRRLVMYGPDLAASPVISGFVMGSDEYWCDNSVAYNGYDVGAGGDYFASLPTYLSSTVDAQAATVSGSIRSTSATNALGGGPLPGAAAEYAFNRPAAIAEAVGDWSLKMLGGDTFALSIRSDGTLTETRAGKTVAGLMTPQPAGVNLFFLHTSENVNVVMVYPLATGGQQMLIFRETAGPMDDIPSVASGRR